MVSSKKETLTRQAQQVSSNRAAAEKQSQNLIRDLDGEALQAYLEALCLERQAQRELVAAKPKVAAALAHANEPPKLSHEEHERAAIEDRLRAAARICDELGKREGDGRKLKLKEKKRLEAARLLLAGRPQCQQEESPRQQQQEWQEQQEQQWHQWHQWQQQQWEQQQWEQQQWQEPWRPQQHGQQWPQQQWQQQRQPTEAVAPEHPTTPAPHVPEAPKTPAPHAAAAAPQVDQPPLSAARLAALTPNERREELGEALYPRVAALVGAQLAAKVTGMLLHHAAEVAAHDGPSDGLDVGALLALLEEPSLLRARAHEACTRLKTAIAAKA